MKMLVQKFLKDEQGLETIEYAVMTALIVAVLIVAIGAVATAVTNRFNTVEGVISGIDGGGGTGTGTGTTP